MKKKLFMTLTLFVSVLFIQNSFAKKHAYCVEDSGCVCLDSRFNMHTCAKLTLKYCSSGRVVCGSDPNYCDCF